MWCSGAGKCWSCEEVVAVAHSGGENQQQYCQDVEGRGGDSHCVMTSQRSVGSNRSAVDDIVSRLREEVCVEVCVDGAEASTTREA